MPQQARTRREIEDDHRRQHILSVAERLFAQRGLIDTSMAEIAKEAEFGVGTLYKYFKDKNTLIQTLLDDRLGEHFDEMERVLRACDSPAKTIEALIDCQLSYVHEHRLFFIVYFTHFHPGTIDGYAGYTGALDHAVMQSKKKRLLKSMNNIFKQGVEAGQFVNIDPEFLSTALFGMFISFGFANERNKTPPWDVDEMKLAMKQILFDRVLLRDDDTEGLVERHK